MGAEGRAPRPDWTPEQRAAIETRGRDLLVSAAAGSGKTAVLAERVLSLLRGGERGEDAVPLESLLVITFTRKAAREMRERIEKKVFAALEDNPADRRLRQAADDLPRSNIMTLHAYCDRLARANFHRAEISPNARICDEAEDREIAAEAAAATLQALAHASPQEDEREAAGGLALLLATASAPAAQTVENAANRVRHFMASLETPEKWRAAVREDLEAAARAKSLADLPWGKIAPPLAASLDDLAAGMAGLGRRAKALGAEPQILAQWRALWQRLADFAARSRNAEAAACAALFQEIGQWAADSEGSALEKLKNKEHSGSLYHNETFREEQLKRFGDRFGRWRKAWFSIPPERQAEAGRLAADRGLALLSLADRIEARAQEIKRRRGLMSFSDVERRALDILTGPEGGPSEIAHQCQRAFSHVLVDEYQDISPLQDAIIRRLSHAEDPQADRNLFIVGDLKQSIYRFRRAEPELFSARMDNHRSLDEPGPNARIDLSRNFRSRPGVLDCVNALFERLMDRSLGGADYDEAAKLRAHRGEAEGAERACVEARWIVAEPRDPHAGSVSELEAEDAGSDAHDDIEGTEAEAGWVAGRIRELIDPANGMWIEDETGERRRARAGDCAILLRAMSGAEEAWVHALARRGLRTQSAAGWPWLETPELVDVVNALRLADNPFQDIPLAAVLRSPMAGLSADDLMRIRLAWRDVPYCEAVWLAGGRLREAGEKEKEARIPLKLARKLEEFFGKLERWREAAERGGAEPALEAVLRATGYESRLAGLRESAKALRGLDDLRLRMRSLAGNAAGAGLPAFLRSLDGAERAGGDEGGGADDPDAVKLLTIHKSKGLEFPIVFAPQLARRFNLRSEDPALDAAMGMQCGGIDPARRLRMTHAALAAMRQEEARRSRAEDMRLLYVAMTRARERLVLVGSSPHWKSETRLRDAWRASAFAGEPRPNALARLKAPAPADLIAPILLELADGAAPPAWLSVEFPRAAPGRREGIALPAARAALADGADEGLWGAAREEFATMFQDDARAATSIASIRAGSSGQFVIAPPPLLLLPPPRHGLSRAPVKVAVSSLERDEATGKVVWAPEGAENFGQPQLDETIDFAGAWARREGLETRAPGFILGTGGGKLDAAARGSLTHLFLKHVDLRGALESDGLRGQARRLMERGLLGLEDPAPLEEIPYGSIEWFFCSPLGRRLAERPGSVMRELPFTRWIMSDNLFRRAEDGALEPFSAPDETPQRILIQGVIDCLMDRGNEALIIDYKTDRIRGQEGLARRARAHAPQVAEYRQAIRTAWRIPVTEAYLVFLDAMECVEVGDESA